MSSLYSPYDLEYIQSRCGMSGTKIQEYAGLMAEGVKFDAVHGVVTETGVVVYDGAHRIEAAKCAGVFVEVDAKPGTRQLAEWLAFGANTQHGIQRTQADIEKIVIEALLHPHSYGKSDRAIAQHCGVTHPTVARYRKELEASGKLSRCEKVTVQRNGHEYEMDRTRQATLNFTEPAPTPEPARPVHASVFVPNDMKPDYEVITITTPEQKIKITAPKLAKREDLKRIIKASFSLEYGDISATLQKMETIQPDDPFFKKLMSLEHTTVSDIRAAIQESCDDWKQLIADGFEEECREIDRVYNFDEEDEEMQEMLDDWSEELETEASEAIEEDDNREPQFYSRDRDRIIRAGLRLFRADGILIVLKEYTLANATRSYANEVDITWGSWKTVEKFDTQKALKDRIQELEHEPDVIFDGRI